MINNMSAAINQTKAKHSETMRPMRDPKEYHSWGHLTDVNLLFEEYLIAAYLYYSKGRIIMDDWDWDELGRYLYGQWDNISSPYRGLVDPEMMYTGEYIRYPNDLVAKALARTDAK